LAPGDTQKANVTQFAFIRIEVPDRSCRPRGRKDLLQPVADMPPSEPI